MTESEKRKKDMKELWKETFHDSDRYIDLVFDTYFSMENSFVKYHENRIIAAMLCVGYEFQILTKEGERRHMRGMYLCGLATRPEWRKRGIMADLMREAEEDAASRGFDLTFLIPADAHLRGYYERKGYLTASWRSSRLIELRGNLDEKHEDGPYVYSIREFFKDGKYEFLSQLADWCREIELSRHNNTIVHSREDFITIMAENENSIFLSKTTIDPEFPILANVLAVAFAEPSETPERPMRVVGLFYQSRPTGELLLEQENSRNNSDQGGKDRNMRESENATTNSLDVQKSEENHLVSEILNSILRASNQQRLELLKPFLGARPKERGAEPYAMVKPLHEIEKWPQNENLEYEISLMLD